MEINNEFNLGDEVWLVVRYEPVGCYNKDELPVHYFAEKSKIDAVKFENWIDEENNERISLLYRVKGFGIKEPHFLYATKEDAQRVADRWLEARNDEQRD